MLLSSADCFLSAKDLIRLWRNECLRILHDRLISVEDKMVVQSKLNEIVSSNFPGFAESVLVDPILFGDYRNAFKVISKLIHSKYSHGECHCRSTTTGR